MIKTVLATTPSQAFEKMQKRTSRGKKLVMWEPTSCDRLGNLP
ncbi:hypothetical protein [Variovorax paradoxus]|jgi:hypothetical protein